MGRRRKCAVTGRKTVWPPRLRGANEFKEPLDSNTCEPQPEFGSPELRRGMSLGPHSTGGTEEAQARARKAHSRPPPLNPGLGSSLL